MDHPLFVIDEAAIAALATDPQARFLTTELLLAGRKNSPQEQPDPETGPQAALRLRQYPTLAERESTTHQY
ncbi:hypothetical protein ACFV6G_24125 [Streptomyces lavendulae]|uniref:hypothetical protein n=1 Tax=Streptomyces lavendulae TaxID=1914 RepID=UPI003694F154